MDAQRFFKVGLPAMVAERLEKFATMSGVLTVNVKGSGKWTVRLGNLEQPVSEGDDPAADLRLWISAHALEAWLDGRLDVTRALEDGHVAAKGDLNVLEHLGFLLQPPGSPLATRLGSF